MYNLARFFLIFITIIIYGCSSINPNYTTRNNNYNFTNKLPPENNLISSLEIHTYTTLDLEREYTKAFCGGLSDCSDNMSNIKNSPLFGGFDLSQKPITNNQLHISKVSLKRIIYTTSGVNNEIRTVSGAMFTPNIPYNEIKGVILFFHPTFFSKASVPSYSFDKRTDIALASIFTTAGYIVVAPDYIGMGIDKSTFHPYVLYPQVNALDGLSLLKATNILLSDKLALNKRRTLPLFIAGYSEGAAYSLWFSRLYQENQNFRSSLDKTNFKLKMVAPISGAYDLSGVTHDYLFSDIGIFTKSNFNVQSSIMAARLKPALLAYTLTSYAYYNENQDYYKVFNPDFFNMNCSLQYSYECKFGTNQLNLYETFNQEQDDVQIVNKISNAASHKVSNGMMFSDQWNSVLPLINQDLLKSPAFIKTLQNGDIYYWHSETPTSLIYLKNDSVVSSYNSIMALRGMSEKNSTNLKEIALDNSLIKENMVDALPAFDVDHITGFNYLFIIALNEFNNSIQNLK